MKIVLIVLFGIIIYTAIGAFAISAISGNEDPIYIFFSIALWPLVIVALVFEMVVIEPAIKAGQMFRVWILKRWKNKN